jgi:hypothetical protein
MLEINALLVQDSATAVWVPSEPTVSLVKESAVASSDNLHSRRRSEALRRCQSVN